MRPSFSRASGSQHFIHQNLCVWQVWPQRLLPRGFRRALDVAFWICLVSNWHRVLRLPMRSARISRGLHQTHWVYPMDPRPNTTTQLNNHLAVLTLCIGSRGIRPKWSKALPIVPPFFPCQNYDLPLCWDRSTFEMQSACPRRIPKMNEVEKLPFLKIIIRFPPWTLNLLFAVFWVKSGNLLR